MRTPGQILRDVKALALEYHQVTGKPLCVTGKITEFEAARVLGLRLADARFVREGTRIWPPWDLSVDQPTTTCS